MSEMKDIDALRAQLDGTRGKAETNLAGTNEEPYALARRRDGGYVVAGVSTASGDDDMERPRGLLLGYRADGTLDPAFGRHGIVLVDRPPCTRTSAVALAIDETGRIVTGLNCAVGDRKRFALVRFASNGSADRNCSSCAAVAGSCLSAASNTGRRSM